MAEQKRIVVIGSNSFSGSDFIDLLLEKGDWSVLGISRSPEAAPWFLRYKRHQNADFRFHRFDLNTDLKPMMEVIDSFRPSEIVNFAAQSEVGPSWNHPGQWFRTNAVALTEFADALKDRKYLRRYLHVSTPEIYGSCVGTVREDAPFRPSTPYAASKAAGDLSLVTFFKNFGLPVMFVRSSNVYGPHQQLFKIIPRTVVYVKMGRTIELHGGGRAVKSYIHIRDISEGELAILERGEPGEVYHLSPRSGGVKIRDLVGTICRRMGTTLEKATRDVSERLGQDAMYVIDSTKARNLFGWDDRIDLETGLGEVVDWVEREWEHIRQEPLEFRYKP